MTVDEFNNENMTFTKEELIQIIERQKEREINLIITAYNLGMGIDLSDEHIKKISEHCVQQIYKIAGLGELK